MENNNEVNDKEREAQNNANNIRNAANVAIASKHPVAMAAGGAIKVADRLTGGRASQKLGSAASKLNRHSPMGNMVQDASNKLSESGASDAVGAAASMKNGTQGNNPSGTDVGQEKLQESFAKRAGNFFKNRKKKKSSTEDGSSDSNNDENNSSDTSSTEDDNQDDEEDKKAKIKKKKIIRFVLSAVAPVLPFLILILLVFVIATAASSVFPLLANQFRDYYDTVNAFTAQEKAYYNDLKKIEDEYRGRCENDELDSNYFHVAIMYQYYLKASSEFEEDTSLESNIPQEEYENFRNVLDHITDYMLPDVETYCHINYEKSDNAHSEESGYSLYRGMYDLISGGDLYLNRVYYPEVNKRAQLKIADGVSRQDAMEIAYKEVLNEIFDYAKMVSDTEVSKDDAVPENFAISDVDENKSILVKDYLAGVIYANVDKSVLTNSEKLKAYTVIYTTNILSKNKISINTQSISSKSLDNFNYCDPNGNCNGKGAISDIVKNTITNSIESVYGNVLVNSNGEYDTLDVSNLYDADGNDFTTILSNAYEGYSIRNAKEDVYDNGVNYGNEQVLTPVTFYDQRSYNSSFCGLKNEVIARSGCGVTSMAMIVSTYENNKKYDPVYMNEEARKKGHCASGNGTYYSHFRYESSVFGYKYLAVRKTSDPEKLNLVTLHLRKGHLIIVHVGKGQFTSGGHYMVLGGIDPATKSVYVYDPYNSYNSKNRKTGNGWYKFNDILKQTKPAKDYIAFQIIWKE